MEHVKAYEGNTCNDEQHQSTGQVTVSTTISRQIPDYVRAQQINYLLDQKQTDQTTAKVHPEAEITEALPL